MSSANPGRSSAGSGCCEGRGRESVAPIYPLFPVVVE